MKSMHADANATQPPASNALGKIGLVMYDNRFCSTAKATAGHSDSSTSSARICGMQAGDPQSFWWITAAINNAWASVHGYELLLYCMHNCRHPDSGERRSPQWCKLIALSHALALGRFQTLLYLDTDAFWEDAEKSMLDGLVHRFAPELLQQPLQQQQQQHPPPPRSPPFLSPTDPTSAATAASAPPAIWFGCNSPWDFCGVPWSYSEPHAASGAAGTGLILVRNDQRARILLREWWHARNGWARPQNFRRTGTCSDQAVLWRMWSARHDLAAWMQVFGRPLNRTAAGAVDSVAAAAAAAAAASAADGAPAPPIGHQAGRRLKAQKQPSKQRRLLPPRTCMRIAGNLYQQRGSPVKHLSSFNPSYRLKNFGRAWNRTRHLHDSRWCVQRYEIDASSTAARLLGRVDAMRGVSGVWFGSRERRVADDASAPPEPPPKPQVCAGGVLHDQINVCCDAACGPVCGGPQSNCSQRPGGSQRCCAAIIREQGPVCKLPEDVACRLPGAELSAPRKKALRGRPRQRPLDAAASKTRG